MIRALNSRLAPSLLLFLFFFSLYLFTLSGAIQFGDETEKYRVAQSIVERGQFSFRATAVRNETGVGGQTVSVYELGQTLLQVPLYVLGKFFAAIFPAPDPNWIPQLFVGLLNPLLTALMVVLFFQLCRAFAWRDATAFALTMVLGLATIVFPYARGYTREPLLTLLTLGAFYAAWRFRQTRQARWILIASLATGYLAFSKFIHAFVIPLILVYVLFAIWAERARAGASRREIGFALLRGLGVFLIPALVFGIAQGAYSFARFGTPFAGAGSSRNPIDWILYVLSGGQPDVATLALLVSPEKSVFLYSPPMLLGVIAGFAFGRRYTQEAILFLALGVIEFLSVITRVDWHGGAWWGPRYFVQFTPFLILPIGVWLESPNARARKIWTLGLGGLSAISLPIQLIGALSSDRDFLDLFGGPAFVFGQFDLLTRGVLDSLVLAHTLAGWRINPFGIMLIAIIVLFGALMVMRWRGANSGVSLRATSGALAFVLLIEFAGFVGWIVAPYPHIVAAKGDTRLLAANQFLIEGCRYEAMALTRMALRGETTMQASAAAQIEQLMPRAAGKRLPIDDLRLWTDTPAGTQIAEDEHVAITRDPALRFESVRQAKVATTSQPVGARPSTAYELSGWIKTENVYGQGYGVMAVYEDNGDWGNQRVTDMIKQDETVGWQPFRVTVTTLPTTRRIFINAGLHNTFGKFWIDGIQLTQIDPNAPPARAPSPCLQYRAIW